MLFHLIKVLLLSFSVSPLSASPWDWSEVDVEKVKLPKEFLWGTAVSEFQVSGAENCPDSQWADWENPEDPSGSATDMWHKYNEDISLMKELGLNSFRFSIEWSLIEPEEGIFDQSVMEHYKEMVRALKEAEITPMVTLHHFSNPRWFEEKGAFEKEENIEDFVRFSKYVFSNLSDEVELWGTINEPTVYTLMGYMLGEFPPGKVDFQLAAEVLKNLLLAHVKVYQELKVMPNGDVCQIGLVHQYLKFEAYHNWNGFEVIPCLLLTNNLHKQVMNFLKTGKFSFYIPFMANLSFEEKEAPESFDFIGLNYYSRAVISMQASLSEPLGAACYRDEIMTDMPYAMYPEGLYMAIAETSDLLGKPIYITENGIADSKDDRRAIFLERYLYALAKASEEGYDVRGYFYWSLIDNYEWAEGWKMKFGLYSLDLETKERTLRDGAKVYQKVISQSK